MIPRLDDAYCSSRHLGAFAGVTMPVMGVPCCAILAGVLKSGVPKPENTKFPGVVRPSLDTSLLRVALAGLRYYGKGKAECRRRLQTSSKEGPVPDGAAAAAVAAWKLRNAAGTLSDT